MKKTSKCPKCGGTKIIVGARIRGDSNYGENKLTAGVFANPDALVFKDTRTTTVSPWICSGCGYVELYADNPQRIDLS